MIHLIGRPVECLARHGTFDGVIKRLRGMEQLMAKLMGQAIKFSAFRATFHNMLQFIPWAMSHRGTKRNWIAHGGVHETKTVRFSTSHETCHIGYSRRFPSSFPMGYAVGFPEKGCCIGYPVWRRMCQRRGRPIHYFNRISHGMATPTIHPQSLPSDVQWDANILLDRRIP